jgi:hypothetical protein
MLILCDIDKQQQQQQWQRPQAMISIHIHKTSGATRVAASEGRLR